MGGYRCRVVNGYGSEFSDVAYLQVFSEYKLIGNNDEATNLIVDSSLLLGAIIVHNSG